jgi:hypothetical protein
MTYYTSPERMYELSITEITYDELKELFILNEHTGKFIRRVDKFGNPYHPTEPREIVKGTFVKRTQSLKMVVKGREYPYHRMVWLYVHGDIDYDVRIAHLNGDKTDNRPVNLAAIPEGRRTLPDHMVPSFL